MAEREGLEVLAKPFDSDIFIYRDEGDPAGVYHATSPVVVRKSDRKLRFRNLTEDAIILDVRTLTYDMNELPLDRKGTANSWAEIRVKGDPGVFEYGGVKPTVVLGNSGPKVVVDL